MRQFEQIDIWKIRVGCVAPSSSWREGCVYGPIETCRNEAHQSMVFVLCVCILLFSFSPWFPRGQTKVWDLRTYKEVHSYLTKTPPTDMDISQRGLLSLGFGCHVQVTVSRWHQ